MTRLKLCQLADIAPDSSLRVDVDDHRIALVRIGDDLYAIGDECSHADYSLAEGIIDADECAIECPKHGSLFGLVDGEPQSMPAIRPVPVYAIEVVDGTIFATIADEAT
ncbi:MAG: non-heme iron oxygenase ferredoxin subunit [Acidimicrobiales bacterium]